MLRNRKMRWFVLLFVAATIWGLVNVRRRGYPYPESPGEHKTDLTVYTLAGGAFLHGGQPYEVANPRGWTYLYPPMLALMLAPLSPLPMQDQVTAWFFISLLFCWGCYRECRRIVAMVCDEDARVAAAWVRWSPWLAVAAVAVAVLPTLNCLQRGQVGVLKLYFLLLGLRWILGGRTRRAWLAGGVALSLPITLKILPFVQVGFLLFLLMVNFLCSCRRRPTGEASRGEWFFPSSPPMRGAAIGRRFAFSTVGVVFGLALFFLFVPAALIGWRANLHHLDTWAKFVLTKVDDGGMDPRSGNSHSARNQSLHNAAYRLGNFAVYVLADGPDDRLVEGWDAPKMAMDAQTADRALLLSQAALALALLALGVRLVRGDGNRLNLAVGFSLGCAAMLVVSPVARGHYFLLLSPAVLLLPLWFDLRGWRRAGVVVAAIPPALSILHYALLPYAGRIGLLGMGTACWLMAAMVLMARADHSARRQAISPRAAQNASTPLVDKAA